MQLFDGKITLSKPHIVPERFREHKKNVKNRIDCRTETLAALVGVAPRQFQNYIKKENPHPIPGMALHKLCEYMNVSPDWLLGNTDEFETMRQLDMHGELLQARLENAVSDLLSLMGTMSDYRPSLITSTDWNTGKTVIDTTTDGKKNPYFKYRQVNGEFLTYSEYQALLNELMFVIDFATDRFVENTVASRNGFE